jgi:hypothetical protein
MTSNFLTCGYKPVTVAQHRGSEGCSARVFKSRERLHFGTTNDDSLNKPYKYFELSETLTNKMTELLAPFASFVGFGVILDRLSVGIQYPRVVGLQEVRKITANRILTKIDRVLSLVYLEASKRRENRVDLSDGQGLTLMSRRSFYFA